MKSQELTQLRRTIADRMKTFRKLRGVTQEQLAESSGLSLNYVSVLELSAKTPSLDALARIAKALGVEASDLLASDRKSTMLAYMSLLLDDMEEKDAEFVSQTVASLVQYVKDIRRS
jgi:transcriptional regulator with XRE-family HTH domain